jgi:uncharacterized cupin superfamily protein
MVGSVTRLAADSRSFVPTNLVDRELLLSGTPDDRGVSLFASDDGAVECGLWACDVYKERIPSYPMDELFVVVEGILVVTVDSQEPEIFSPGDAFIIRRGTACVLDFQAPFRKYYMTYEPRLGK